ncbi:MAG: hypothetical protein ACJ76F_05205, partial [Bacteroidia bacterium]
MKKLFFFSILIFLYVAGKAQFSPLGNVTPDAVFDTLYDKDARKYSLRDLRIDTNQLYVGSPGSKVLASCPTGSGYFRLFFETGCGMDGNTTADIDKRKVLCQLFKDISTFMPAPTGTPLANGTAFVNVWVRNIANISNVPASTAGLALSFYPLPTGSAVTGIADNMVWTTVNSGYDGYTNFSSPLIAQGGGQSNNFYHMAIAFDFSLSTWHYTWSGSTLPTAAAGVIDLYSIALHEATHALGFASLIRSNGQSVLPQQYYSRYDLHLKNNAATQNLITNTGSCNLYSFGWNSSLTASTTLSPNAGSPNPNHTTCGSAIKYAYTGGGTQMVYTTNAFQQGSSLSHFEDECQVPATFTVTPSNDEYFVMSNSGGTTNNKRFLRPEERSVLCDLGYYVTNSYGSTTVTQSANTYTASACNGSQVVGINDGISSTGAYQYVTSQNTLINIPCTTAVGTMPAVLLNDQFASATLANKKLECVQDITNNTTVSFTATNITYTPPTGFIGTAVLRYVPYDNATGIRGNITYIYVFVRDPNCINLSSCDMVSNGNFESNGGCSIWSNVKECWQNLAGTCDRFGRGCTGIYNVGTSTFGSTPASDSHNGTPNDKFVGFGGEVGVECEAISTNLNTALAPSANYVLSFWAKNCNAATFSGSPMLIGFSSVPSQLLPLTISQNFNTQVPGASSLIPSQTVPFDNAWHYYSVPFTFTGTVNHNTLVVWCDIFPAAAGTKVYSWIDEISIVPAAVGPVLTVPPTVCLGSNISNLMTYVSPTGGVFSGTGVSLSGGIYSFNSTTAGLGTHLITYTYTSGACSYPSYANITVANSGCTLPGGNSNSIAAATTYTTTNTNFSLPTSPTSNPILISANVTIGNGTSTNTVTVNCPDVRIASGVKILVKANATLVIDGSWLHACAQCNGGMWQGIEVESGATLEVKNNTIIEDALYAVNALSGTPNLKISNAVFNKNDYGININSTASNLQASTTNIVKNCIFSCRTLAVPSTLAGFAGYFSALKSNMSGLSLSSYPITTTLAQVRSRYGMYLNALTYATAYKVGTTATTGNPELNFFDYLDYGIYVSGSNANIKNNTFQNCSGRNNSGLVTGIGVCGVNPSDPYSITIGNDYNSTTYPTTERNVFRNNLRGVDISNFIKNYVINNSFDNTFVDTWANFSYLYNTTGQYAIFIKPKITASTNDLKANKNVINNCSYGVYINRLTNFYDPTTFEVNNNAVTVSGGNHMAVGLFMEDAAGNSPTGTGILYFKGNTVIGADYFGILANNIYKGLQITSNNELSVTAANPSGFPGGSPRASIGLQYCNDAQVDKNLTVKATNFTTTANINNVNADLYGIFITGSPGSIVTCNQVQNTDKAIAFEGSCSASANRTTRYEQNNHYTTNFGYVLQNAGAIGTQGSATVCMDNVYGNTGTQAITIAQTFVISTSTANTGSKLYVRANTCSSVTVTQPCNNLGSGATPYSTTAFGINISSCVSNIDLCAAGGGEGGKLIGYSDSLISDSINASIAAILLNQLNDSTTEEQYGMELSWQREKYIFEVLDENSALRNNAQLNLFYNNKFNSNMGKLARI